MTMETISKMLENIVIDSADELEALPSVQVEFKPSPVKWSKKEILGHLVDSATNNLHRFVRGQYGEVPHIVYDQDEWVKIQNYQEMPFGEIINLWQIVNKQIAHILKNIPEDKLNNQVNTGKGNEELHSLGYLADDYLVHLNHHLEQILK